MKINKKTLLLIIFTMVCAFCTSNVYARVRPPAVNVPGAEINCDDHEEHVYIYGESGNGPDGQSPPYYWNAYSYSYDNDNGNPYITEIFIYRGYQKERYPDLEVGKII